MTREEAKELLTIIQALTEGKTIQFRTNNRSWVDLLDNDIEINALFEYRIKPEQKYRPFKTQEECWNEMLKHQPFGWVKAPDGKFFCIDMVLDEGIVYKYSSCKFDEYLNGQYSFVDGEPFGIKEE